MKFRHSFFVILLSVVSLTYGVAQTFFQEGFEGFSSGYTFPSSGTGWYQESSGPSWGVNAGTHHPSGYAAHGGSNVAWFNSWHYSSGSSRLISPVIDLSSASVDPTLEFWMFRDDGFSSYNDRLRVHLSTDGGNTWTQLADYARYSSLGDYWEQKSLVLTGAAGRSSVRIVFEGISDWGNDIHIDDIRIYAPAPMQYIDSWAEQVFGTAAPGSSNNPILKIVIETDGTLNPLVAELITVVLKQGTVASASFAKIWYSGSLGTFDPATATLLGTASVTGSGEQTVNFSFSQSLSAGINYFWITVDVRSDAAVYTPLDARFPGVTVSGNSYTPSVTDPDGAARVWFNYCASSATSQNDTYCSGVIIGSWANYSTSATGAVYTNYVGVLPPLPLLPGQTYPLSVIKDDDDRSYFYSGYAAVYIDWNRDGDYFDSNELVFWTSHGSSSTGPIVVSGSFTVPSNITPGLTGMRVLVYENSISTPCHTGTWGETEDYAVELVGLTVSGDGNFGIVGKERRKLLTVTNGSSVDLRISNVQINNAAFRLYVPGTDMPVSFPYTLPAGESVLAELAFGNPSWTPAGQSNGVGTLTYQTDDGSYTFPAIQMPLSGYYASLRAYQTTSQGTKDLLAPGEYFDLGGAELGTTQPLIGFLNLQPDMWPVDLSAPIEITSWSISGPDAALFSVTGMPAAITQPVGISVSMVTAGVSPGVKTAYLTIEHTGANGPAIQIELQGRIGNPILSAPTLVYTPPIARGYVYSNPYENVAYIPLTVPQPIEVEMYGTPTITGSGAARFELVGNSGRYYLKGMYDVNGNVVPIGSLTDPANWVSATPSNPVVISPTQPYLLVVRMSYAPVTVNLGTYNAEIALTGSISNAMNTLVVTIVGQVVNDPSILEMYPTQLDFGTVAVGTVLSKMVILRNQSGVAGTALLSITGMDFHFANGQQTLSVNLPAINDPVSVPIYFEPVGVGQRTGQLNASGVLSSSIPLTGVGIAADPQQVAFLIDGASVNPLDQIDFGQVQVGQIGQKQLIIQNNSSAPIVVTGVSRSGNHPTQFAVNATTPFIVVPNGGTGAIQLQFVPTNTSPAIKTAHVIVYISNGLQTIPYLFYVRGEATYQGSATPMLTITPSQYNFGNQSGTQDFVITNHGSTPQTISYLLILGSNNFSLVNPPSLPYTLNGNGGTVTVTVAFDASSGPNGLRSGTLLVIAPGVTPYPTATLRGTVGNSIIANGKVESLQRSSGLMLLSISPNPVRQSTVEIRYSCADEYPSVEYAIYNPTGQRIQSGILSGTAGEHSAFFDLGALPSGQYFLQLQAAGATVRMPFTILR